MVRLRLVSAVAVIATLATVGSATPWPDSSDQPLSLEAALKLAKERNGAVRAALADLAAARARTHQSLAAFLPTLTPTAQYVSDRHQVDLGDGSKPFVQSEGWATSASASWRLLDSGQRQMSYMATRRAEAAADAGALQTLRSTLFDVHQQFLDALRAQELLKVSQGQAELARTILDQTKVRVQVGDVARKEILQAQADSLNAQVQALAAKTDVDNARATLKATLGWEAATSLPPLEPTREPSTPKLPTLAEVLKVGLAERRDLVSARRRVESLRFIKLRADRQAGPLLSLDARYDQAVSPVSLEGRSVALTLTVPFFDGGLSRAQAEEAKQNWISALRTFEQEERTAGAEIEAAYNAVETNANRLGAARAALEAAQTNYQAAEEAQRLGASTLLDVLTARVTLATAQSGSIQALHDFVLAEVRLRLVTGQPIPGEA
ncbi:MAG: TolC family protein [Fimbriimonas ginsengisoli]|uniref:TolC family protein n=1 Tax=Fimbriimonas ginsengisoli TaxID=1005039 RepID=A0A931LW73_FIMGI|nr:TolC family protein [Fimbriimonas ginsengisoli]